MATRTHTHTTLYMWMHSTPSRISSSNCKVAQVFSQKLGTWKMLNKWWLLFPCAAKFWEPIGIVPGGKWTLIRDLCRCQCSVERCKFANLLNNPIKTLSIHLKTLIILLILLFKSTACFVHTWNPCTKMQMASLSILYGFVDPPKWPI